MRRIECTPEEATVAVWGEVEYRRADHAKGRWKCESGTTGDPYFMLKRGAKFYKEVQEPCVLRFDGAGSFLFDGSDMRNMLFGNPKAFDKAAYRKATGEKA